MAKFTPRAQTEGNDDGLKEKMIAVNRVTKVVKGGRTLSFAALTVVGDGDGRIGMGKGKAKEVPVAVQKAMEAARRNMVKVSLKNGTIHHVVEGEHGAGQVLECSANRLEQGDLLGRFAAGMGAGAEFRQFGPEVGAGDQPGAHRLHDVAGFGHRTLIGVDKQAGAGDRSVVAFAHGRLEGADKVEMGAGLEPFAGDQRLLGQRAAGDDVGLSRRFFEIADRFGRQPPVPGPVGGLARLVRIAAPDNDLRDRPGRRMGSGKVEAQAAGAGNQQGGRIRPGEIPGGQGAGRRCPPGRQLPAIQDGEQFAGARR